MASNRVITIIEPQSLVVFSEYSAFYSYLVGATAQTLDREEGLEYFLFVQTKF